MHFNEKRPETPTFPLNQQHCILHGMWKEGGRTHTGLSPEGISCPCVQTGNVDITTILDFILKQLGFAKSPFEVDQEIPSRDSNLSRSWESPRFRCNYDMFLKWTLEGNRFYHLLKQLNGIPKWKSEADRDQFYQSLGPGLEAKDDEIGYNAGDVIEVVLLMRFLTTTDARKPFIARLMSYAFGHQGNYLWEYSPRSGLSTAVLSSLSLDATSRVALVDDYPRTWRRDCVGGIKVPKSLSLLSLKTDQYTQLAPPEPDEGPQFLVSDFFDSHVMGRTRELSYYEHHKRALTARDSYAEAIAEPGSEIRYSPRSPNDVQYFAHGS